MHLRKFATRGIVKAQSVKSFLLSQRDSINEVSHCEILSNFPLLERFARWDFLTIGKYQSIPNKRGKIYLDIGL
jgi:hypothetical protein